MHTWLGDPTGWMGQRKSMRMVGSLLLVVTVLIGAVSCGGATGGAASQRATSTPTPKPTPTATPIPFARPEVEAGVTVPEWSQTAYSKGDMAWRQALVTMQSQTGARWVSIVVDLYQDTFQSTTVHPGSGTPTPQALKDGITYAHSLGLKVFIEPLLTVNESPNWGGLLYFSSYAQSQAWFDGYWAGYQPYVQAAQAAGADQLGIATELQALEMQPDSLWNTLISRIHADYSGHLTYDMNWNSLTLHIPQWLGNPALDYIGISEYQPIAQSPQTMSADQIRSVWTASILPTLDHLSDRFGKSIIFTEIGYRNATDALYRPWDHETSAPADPSLQAAAYTVAAQVVFSDKHLVGLFFWAWGTGSFSTSPEAAAALKAQYLSTAA